MLERFYRGARNMEALHHEHIVRILEAPTKHDGFHYFVMAYLPKGDLQRAIRKRQVELSPQDQLRLLLEVADAIQFAHERGLIHRDIKPTNVATVEKSKARFPESSTTPGKIIPRLPSNTPFPIAVSNREPHVLRGLSVTLKPSRVRRQPVAVSRVQDVPRGGVWQDQIGAPVVRVVNRGAVDRQDQDVAELVVSDPSQQRIEHARAPMHKLAVQVPPDGLRVGRTWLDAAPRPSIARGPAGVRHRTRRR